MLNAWSLAYTSKFSVAGFLWQRYLLVYKESKCYVENLFAYAPEMTIDSEDKTEETVANLLVYGNLFFRGKIPANFLMYSSK